MVSSSKVTASLLVYISALCYTRHSFASSTEGLSRLCTEGAPDGFAALNDAKGGEDLLVFSSNDFWILDMEKVKSSVNSGSDDTKLILRDDGLNVDSHFTFFPSDARFIVSFSGLETNDKFYNSLMVFGDDAVTKYTIASIDRNAKTLSAKSEGIFSTTSWVNLKSVQVMYAVRGSRLVISSSSARANLGGHKVNMKNLESPPWFDLYYRPDLDLQTTKLLIELPKDEGHLTYSTTGQLCIKKKCRPFKDLIKCTANDYSFNKTFSHWLYNNTFFTYNVVIIVLLGLQAISFTLAVVFVYNQIRRLIKLV